MKLETLFQEDPVFETGRLILRKLKVSDAEAYYKIASDPAVSAHTTWARHETIEDTVGFLERVEERHRMRQAFHWGIVFKPNGRLIGRT